MRLGVALVLGLMVILPSVGYSDERFFTYSYQADVVPKGALEFEQSITSQSGKREGDFSQWDFRSELEYGITSKLMTALYLNWENVRQQGNPEEEDHNTTKIKGFSSEWIYQLLNPNLDPVGVALYGEYSTNGSDQEVEGKILLNSRIDNWEFVTNAAYEIESEGDAGSRERESTLTFTAGASYKLSNHWATGIEVRNKSAYPGGLDLNGQEYQAWSVGPNLHYGASEWWATLTILPQIWGNGDGSSGGRQLDHEESLEARLIFGIDL